VWTASRRPPALAARGHWLGHLSPPPIHSASGTVFISGRRTPPPGPPATDHSPSPPNIDSVGATAERARTWDAALRRLAAGWQRVLTRPSVRSRSASQYYKFAATTLLAMGVLFQVPVAILAVTRAGLITARQLRGDRRYAIGACALVGAVLPGDVISMLLETVPLYLLLELSVLIAAVFEGRVHLAPPAAVTLQ
jgi:Sec-independent protein translocase protein (TatC)